MPRSRKRKNRTLDSRVLTTEPHLRTEDDLCRRCQHRWPCPSAVAGEDLPDSSVCLGDSDVLPEGLRERVELVNMGLVVDSGQRRRAGRRLLILWTLSAEGRVLAPHHDAHVQANDEPPGEEELLRVLQWLVDNEPVRGTSRAVAERCGRALGWPPAQVERCLLWATANGLSACRETA